MNEQVESELRKLRRAVKCKQNCLGISSEGDENLVLNQQGNWVEKGGGTDLVLYKENPVSPTPNTVTGDNAVAIGSGCTASGESSISMGLFTTASGMYSFASGVLSSASGQSSVAEGNGTTASGINSHAQNAFTFATGDNSHAEGNGSEATGLNSHAQNEYTKANAVSSTAIGRYNVGGGDSASWIATDPLFEIGNGTGDLARANALTVYKNGYIVPTIPSYANDAAADADTSLPSGGLYKLNAGRTIYQKP